jgi:Uma2 family endonuclease
MNLLPPLTAPAVIPGVIVYPESDGKPMSDNTKQFRWIVLVFTNLAAIFEEQDVFLGGNLLWYPVEGHPEICNAPDVFVVFGRPKGDRPSYKQWEENNVPMTVVFEILSPGNGVLEMDDKRDFYEDYGVEEYYLYDPDTNTLKAFVRKGEVFRRVRPVHNHVSPRLGIRFDLSGPELVIYDPNGLPFLPPQQIKADRDREHRLRLAAEQQSKDDRSRADEEHRRADEEHRRADQAEEQRRQTQQQLARVLELFARFQQGQATAEELQELARLHTQPPTGN